MGGRGGGILFLNISDTLDIEGTLSADGDNHVGSEAGGGSGGSILIRTVTLEGSGTVQVSSVRSSLSKALGGLATSRPSFNLLSFERQSIIGKDFQKV